MIDSNDLSLIDDIDYTLSQLGAYFAMKIRADENVHKEIDLYCAVNRIREHFKTIKYKLENSNILEEVNSE